MFRSWKNWRSIRLTARGWIVLVVGIIALPLAYVGTQSDATTPASISAAPTRVNHYETPCELRERTARNIPTYSVDHSKGLIAYVWEHLDENYVPDAELADYWAALDACDVNEPVAQWDFDNMILVNVEYIGG